MIQGDDIPNLSYINCGINIDMHLFSNGLVNGFAEISLKIILGVGQSNKWEVKWVGVLEEPSGDKLPTQTQAQVEAQLENNLNSTNVAVEPV